MSSLSTFRDELPARAGKLRRRMSQVRNFPTAWLELLSGPTLPASGAERGFRTAPLALSWVAGYTHSNAPSKKLRMSSSRRGVSDSRDNGGLDGS
jgi:hypothetical protein